MKNISASILGAFLLLVGAIVYAILLEGFDFGTLGLIIMLWLVPIVVLAVLNGYSLYFAEKCKSKGFKLLFSLLPIILMFALTQFELRILDMGINPLAWPASFAFLISNSTWIIRNRLI